MTLQILGLGAGVQSSCLALMSVRGVLPRLDHSIFADTQNEPEAVYANLNWLAEQLARAGITHHTCTAGDITDPKNIGRLPLFTRNPDGSKGQLMRACTHRFKLYPAEKTIRREILGLPKGTRIPKGTVIEYWMGISADEAQRMKPPSEWWKIHVYPLCNLAIYPDGRREERPYLSKDYHRADCKAWLSEHYPGRTFPRSACCVCPYRRRQSWEALTESELKKTIEIDKNIVRNLDGVNGTPYLHSARKPLDRAIEENRQSLFDDLGADDICDGGTCWS